MRQTPLSSPGLTGRPSIPETAVFNREAAAYWIARSSRAISLVVAGGLLAMTKRNFDSNFKQQIHVHILAAGDARGLRFVSLKLEGAGNAGCALHPRSRVQNG